MHNQNTQPDFLSELNPPQREAVMHIKGPVMIIAGAGSGKTRVLTYRIAHLINSGIDAFNILALTFTNKAAREMKHRIMRLAGDDARNLWMGTFHSVFARVLRIEASKIGYPSDFTIYDTDDSRNLIKDILKEQGLDDKVYKPSVIHNRISSFKNNLIGWEAYSNDSEYVSQDIKSGKPKFALLFELYSKRCFKAGAMDFDDLLFNTYLLLQKYTDLLSKYQDKFRYIMVDEFQDTNYAQYVIVRLLAARFENICVVGDDAQSIYAFRGANIQNILNFEKDYPDLATYKLEQNYRSTGTIVNAANSVIACNKFQLPKSVWTHNQEGDKISLLRSMSDNEEGNKVANAVFQDRMNFQLQYSDFAVLYRTNAQSRSIEEALRKSGIPYRIYGGLSFYNRKEIKDMLAYFRLTINHHDEEAFKRIVNYPKREIGKTTIDRLIVSADREQLSIWDIAKHAGRYCPDINKPTIQRLQNFVTMIEAFAVVTKSSDAYEAASHIANSSGLMKELYNDRTPEGISRFENLQELLNAVKTFAVDGRTSVPAPDLVDEQTGEIKHTLGQFMQDIALLTDADQDTDDDNNKVSLMTVHAAKGLEFKEVFIVGLEENLFPNQMSMESRADLEEERRLFYVAVTRAEKKLYLMYAQSRYRFGTLIYNEPSRFIEEINSEYIHSNIKSYNGDDTTLPERWDNQFVQSANFNRSKSSLFKQTGNKPATPPAGFKKIKSTGSKQPTLIDADDATLIVTGMQVEHERFGLGKVVAVEGEMPDKKCTVFFQGVGSKQLLMRYARLKIIE